VQGLQYVLYYFRDEIRAAPQIHFIHCKIFNNTESTFAKNLIYNNVSPLFSLSNLLHIYHSDFYNNSNVSSMIVIKNYSSRFPYTLIINYCNFTHNHIQNIIKDYISDPGDKWRRPVYIAIYNTIISYNTHNNGVSLITLHSGKIKWNKCLITNNSYYQNIMILNLAYMRITGHFCITNNHARYILNVAFIIIDRSSTLLVSQNTVYTVMSAEISHSTQLKQPCYYRFEIILKEKELYTSNYYIIVVDNIYTAPMHLTNSETFFKICKLSANRPTSVILNANYLNFVNLKKISINKTNIGIIPSSICKCANFTDYQCSSHELGQVYPGQTLTTHLIVPRSLSSNNSVILLVETAHLPPTGCRVTKATEMSQMHTSPGCNQYHFTVWSNRTECELYLSMGGIPEIFYVKLLPCPVGFSLHHCLQKCHCDPVLNCDVMSVTTCNLADGTILRPANSWISADSVNGYHVSSQCPFDYCLSYSSYLNLSTPDMQCQFNRSGVLCGHCQQDLSAVFGSSQCKKCSNIYLFIMMPIAVAGIMLVIVLFVLNLTVTNGTINTFIFYINVITMNYSTLLPNCHSPICVLLSMFNLDLGIETCFYNNMSNYSKTCLQLAFPFYLITIALALIMGRRYSSRIQRLTARRGLHVLATLFLLSYTKILSMVCHILFFYSQVTHLPSRHTQLFWSVDTSVELFGVKFTILFVACLVIFLLLLSFNFLLLFTRLLLRFKIVSTFKPLLDPYFGSYKDKSLYWTGLQLLVRAVFFSLSALDTEINLLSGSIVTAFAFCAHSVVQPFKNNFYNIQESFILLNLSVVYVVALHNYYSNTNNTAVEYIILLVLVYFILVIMYSCLASVCDHKMRQFKNIMLHPWKKNERTSFELSYKNMTSNIPDVTYNYSEFREPLVAVTD